MVSSVAVAVCFAASRVPVQPQGELSPSLQLQVESVTAETSGLSSLCGHWMLPVMRLKECVYPLVSSVLSGSFLCIGSEVGSGTDGQDGKNHRQLHSESDAAGGDHRRVRCL